MNILQKPAACFVVLTSLCGATLHSGATLANDPKAKVDFRQTTGGNQYQTICVNKHVIRVSKLEAKAGSYKLSDFSLKDKHGGNQIPIKFIIPIEGFQASSVPRSDIKYTKYDLYGDIEPKASYVLSVAGHPDEIDVTFDEGKVAKKADSARASGRLNIEPLVDETSGTAGIKFNSKYRLECLFDEMPFGFAGSINLNGEFGLDQGEENFDRTFNSDLNFKYFRRPWELNGREYINAFRVSPLGIEGDQAADKLNYVGKIEYATQIPYTDSIAQTFGAGRGHAAQLLTGYTYSVGLRDELADEEFDPMNRWDAEIVWGVKLKGALGAELRWKAFYDLEESELKERFIGTVRYSLGDGTNSDLVISYRDGGDAPIFKDEQSLRVGLDIKFGNLSEILF